MQDLKYWLAWSKINGLGPIKIKKISEYFPNMESAWQADSNELIHAGIDNTTIEKIIIEKNQINPDELLAELEHHKISAVCLSEKHYPKHLKQIYDPPPVLYYRGKLPDEKPLIAIVGTRKISTYGIQITKQLVPKLIKQKLNTISGMALGVDSLAHQETINTGGNTFAVLGNGLDQQNIYPSSNRFLAKKIIDSGGAIISEYPPGTLPLKQHFPRRNRIISGMSLGVLVIEGNISSGSLITAKIALEQNREVMAIPGNIFSNNSQGTNELIKNGAIPITDFTDVINALNLQILSDLPEKKYKPDDETERKIINILNYEPITIDEIIRKTKLSTSVVVSKLNILKIKGIIKNVKHDIFVKTR